MGTYNSAVITNGGQSMIAQAVAGASLEFTTIKTSSYAYPAGTNFATLTTINGIKQSKDITSATVYNSRVIKISAAVDNTGISTAYTINTIGIYAKVGSSAESLFAVVTASAADTMPAYDSKPYSYIYEINLTMQNAANVTVTVNAAGLVNVADLNAAKVEIRGEIDDLKSDLNFQTNTERITSFVNRAYIKTNISVGSVVNLTPVAATAYSYSINACNAGDIFVINGMGGGAPRLWAFIDDDNKLLSVSTNSLAGDDLVIIAPNKAKNIIINSETKYLGVCYHGYISKRISIIEGKTYDFEKAYPIPGASRFIKELYIQDLKGYTLYRLSVFIGAVASSTGLYFSEIRLEFNNNPSRFIRICLQNGYATSEQAIASINYYNNKVYEFNDLVINGTNDTISGYIIFDVSEESPGQTIYANITVNDLSNSYYSPTIANALTAETVNTRTVCSAVNNAINGENTYQAEDDFKDLENVNVFKNGVLVSPSLYTLYPHGKAQFVSGAVNQGDELRFEYNKFQKSYPDFSNDFSTALYGMGVYEENGSNMWSFADDPAGAAGKVLKISRNTQVTGNLIRCQLYRSVSYTEFYHEVKAYFTKELLDAIISYPGYVHWFALSADWAPYGSVSGTSTNLYSGSSNFVQLYKTNAEDDKVHYNIINRKREVVGGVESYETIAFNVSDFEALADEWITLRLHVKVGNPGIFELTVIDSNGTHTLKPMRGGNEVAYVGLADPENETELYGSNVAPVIPTRKVYETMFAKLYTSADIANHIINENGEVAIYFKDYKEYDCVNVNAF